MSMFRKPQKSKSGAKILFYGSEGTGKTISALTFPNNLLIDAELGSVFYEGTEDAKNTIGVLNTQSYKDVEKAIKEVEKNYEDMGVETLITDSMTKIRQSLTSTVTQVDVKRARREGKSDADIDTSTSIRSWGTIGRISKELQNMKIDLSANGVHIVDIAQAKEEKDANNNLIGYKADIDKSAPFDYDIIVRMFTQLNAKGEPEFKGIVEKDRTKKYDVGTILENITYETWADVLEANKDEEAIEVDYTGQVDSDAESYESEIETAKKPLAERMQAVLADLDDEGKKELAEKLKAKKITSLNTDNLTKAKQEALVEILKEYED